MPFKTGQSGCPTGRPKGAKDRRTVLREMIELHQEELLTVALNMARSGNEPMLKLLLERILPTKPKDSPRAINIMGNTFVEKAAIVMKSISAGDISVSDAETLMRTIALESKIYENEVIKNDVEELMRIAKHK